MDVIRVSAIENQSVIYKQKMYVRYEAHRSSYTPQKSLKKKAPININ
jgi:hypothetical protein